MTNVIKMPERYWLCTGSTKREHDSRCTEALRGHPERCVYGTAKQHSLQKPIDYLKLNK